MPLDLEEASEEILEWLVKEFEEEPMGTHRWRIMENATKELKKRRRGDTG